MVVEPEYAFLINFAKFYSNAIQPKKCQSFSILLNNYYLLA